MNCIKQDFHILWVKACKIKVFRAKGLFYPCKIHSKSKTFLLALKCGVLVKLFLLSYICKFKLNRIISIVYSAVLPLVMWKDLTFYPCKIHKKLKIFWLAQKCGFSVILFLLPFVNKFQGNRIIFIVYGAIWPFVRLKHWIFNVFNILKKSKHLWLAQK